MVIVTILHHKRAPNPIVFTILILSKYNEHHMHYR
jgi:hypothetical protein